MPPTESPSSLRATVIICTDDPRLQQKLLDAFAGWPEFEVIAVTATVSEADGVCVARPPNLVLVDAILAGRNLEAAVGGLARHGSSIVALMGRGAAPSVLELPQSPAARALQLPRWVLDRKDDVTAAHTRALLLDLCELSSPVHTTTEIAAPGEPEEEQSSNGGSSPRA